MDISELSGTSQVQMIPAGMHLTTILGVVLILISAVCPCEKVNDSTKESRAISQVIFFNVDVFGAYIGARPGTQST
jgi:hypothetical protein